MSSQVKISLFVAGAFAVVIALLLVVTGRDTAEPGSDATGGTTDPRLVRADSHTLGETDDKGEAEKNVVLVEFLDFECEGCLAAYPVVEKFRETYGDRVRFVARYFPMPGHFNGERAARAVEAAARQGEFEAMFHRMYETQTTWGEQRVPHDALFRSFAEDLGLDLAQFDADYASAEVAARVQRDVDDGLSLGVRGTPTFFLNGQHLQPTSVADFEGAIKDALGEE